MIRHCVTVLLIVLSCSLTSCAYNGENAAETARDFSLQSVSGRTVRLSDYQGKVILLNFFATWCPPCRSEIPDFNELLDDYRDQGFVILGISVERGDPATLKDFADEYGITYPVLIDDGLVSRRYGPIQSIPTTFIIDRDGNLVTKVIGSRDKLFFEETIAPFL